MESLWPETFHQQISIQLSLPCRILVVIIGYILVCPHMCSCCSCLFFYMFNVNCPTKHAAVGAVSQIHLRTPAALFKPFLQKCCFCSLQMHFSSSIQESKIQNYFLQLCFSVVSFVTDWFLHENSWNKCVYVINGATRPINLSQCKTVAPSCCIGVLMFVIFESN